MRHAMMSLLVAALVAGLATSPAAAEAPTSLVVQTVAEPPGLDLTATPASATSAVVFYNVQEALVKVDRHGKLVPWLAERWHTTDNRNYTFFLKRGVHFRSEEYTSELQSHSDLVCRLLLEKKKLKSLRRFLEPSSDYSKSFQARA